MNDGPAWVDEPWVLEMRRTNIQILQDFPQYVKSLQENEAMSKKATDHVVFDIDELVGFGTVKLSSATLKAFKAELEETETGHHVGNIALIHSSRAATNARLAESQPAPEPTPEPVAETVAVEEHHE